MWNRERLTAVGAILAWCAAASAQSGWSAQTSSLVPAVRAWHGMAHDWQRSRTVMFGGWSGGSVVLGDTWEWDGSNWRAPTTTAAPTARCCHRLVYDVVRSRILLFGGGGITANDLDDTWEFDGVNWVQRQPTRRPPARRQPGLAFDPATGTVLLFGGGVTNLGSPVLGDTWRWDGTDWAMLQPAGSPSARWCHGMAPDFANNTIVLFGGNAGAATSSLDDTWLWNGATWRQVAPTRSPSPRINHGMTWDVYQQAVVTWGGLGSDAAPWLWDGKTWRPDQRSGTPVLREGLGWAHDPTAARIVMFGGYNGTLFADTWEYTSGPIARWLPGGAGCMGTQGVPLLLPAPGSLPVLGTTFGLELASGTGGGLAAIAVGFSDLQWSGGALPADLTPFGMPGCWLRTAPEFLGFVVLAGGRTRLHWPLPGTPGLIGTRFHAQGLVLDPAANALGAVVSNAGTGVAGPF